MNARASRTTHPKTIRLLEDFFSEIREAPMRIATPFLWKTKTDIFRMVGDLQQGKLITSTVSCSETFQNISQATHCGGCSQCIDRRFAAYASELDDVDEAGIYAQDFIQASISNGEVKTTLLDYVRQASEFATWNIDYFWKKRLNELVYLTDYIPEMDEPEEAVRCIWDLCYKHGNQVLKAITRMRGRFDNPFNQLPPDSFLQYVAGREYLKEPIQRLVEGIVKQLTKAIPITFQKNPPKDENDFNDKVSGILNAHRDEFEREHPAVRFALARVIPDHSWKNHDLFLESKYIRGSTSPSKASEGLAADLIKYPEGSHILFIVYDPERSISNDEQFRKDFERRGRCNVCIIR